MKINKFTGWNHVFSFTLIQSIKSKAYIISLIILVALTLCSMPIVSLLTSEADLDKVSPIEKVYIDNQSSISSLDFSGLEEIKQMSHISIETMDDTYDVVSGRIEEGETASVILSITESSGVYSFQFIKASEGPVGKTDLELLGTEITQLFDKLKIDLLEVSQDQLDIIHSTVTTNVTTTDVQGDIILEEDTSISFTEYWFVYGLLFILMMINILAGTSVATSITTEKSTRVVEYLLISVEPLALMLGKVLAMLVTVMIQMISLVLAAFASNRISSMINDSSETLLAQYLPTAILDSLNPINIILCFILFTLGMIFYATLASLAGATVSRLEEISEGLTIFTIVNMVGVYMGFAAAQVLTTSGVNGYVLFTFLFPLSSPFILPGAILVGKVSILYLIIAIILLLLFTYLLFLFVAKVYETLILHNGNTIKLKELIRISKSV